MNEEYGRDNNVPFSIEAEQAVLGSVLREPSCLDNLIGMIASNDFYLVQHKEIFRAMEVMYLKSRDIDIVTLVDELVKDGVYTEAGGKEYIQAFYNAVPTASNVEDYAAIVLDKSVARQLISACADISNDAYAEKYTSKELIEQAEDKIYKISDSRENHDFIHIKDALALTFKRITDTKNTSPDKIGMKTGFGLIDRFIIGMNKGDFVLVGARPGVGKTSFVMNVAVNAAIRNPDKKVCVFSLEMSAEQLATRLLASEACVDSTKLRSAQLTTEEYAKLGQAAGHLSQCQILIDDSTDSTVSSIKAKLRRTDNVGLVIIDYLGLMQSEKEDRRRSDNKANEVAAISRNLKLMAKDFAIPVLTCAQLNRESEKRTGNTSRKPTLADFRDSGAIEQDADIVFLLSHPQVDESKDAESRLDAIKKVDVDIAKNRHGSVATVSLGWQPEYTRFVEVNDLVSEP